MAWGMKNIVICVSGSSIMEGRIGVEDPLDRWYNIFQRLLSRRYPEICFPIVNGAVGGASTRELMGWFDRDILPFATKHPAYQDCLAAFGGDLDASLNPERQFARAFYVQHGWPYLDLYALMSDDPGKYVLREDGVHLNKTGHELFAREMFEVVSGLLGERVESRRFTLRGAMHSAISRDVFGAERVSVPAGIVTDSAPRTARTYVVMYSPAFTSTAAAAPAA
jgi:hypothetical protein